MTTALFEGYDEKVAYYWKLATQVKEKIAHCESRLGTFQELEEIPLPPSPEHRIQATQLMAIYVAQSLRATQEKDHLAAHFFAQKITSIKEALACYENVAMLLHQKILSRYHLEEQSVRELAATCQQRARTNERHIRQQWAEAACLGQEATVRLKKLKSLNHDSSVAHRWVIAACWSYRAALFKKEEALALEEKNFSMAADWNKIASAAEHASTYRAKAASTTNSLLRAIWTKSAVWAGNTSCYRKEGLTQLSQITTQDWMHIADRAESIFTFYTKAAKYSHPFFSWVQRYWIQRALRVEKVVIRDLTSLLATTKQSLF